MNATVIDVVAGIAFVAGSLLTVAAALAVRRFPNFLARLHAPTKPQVVGLAFMLLGLAISLRDPAVAWTCLLVFLFQLITSPVSTHLAARAGYRTGHVRAEELVADEYRRDIIDSQQV